MPEKHDLKPRITVFGVGGAGGNAVNNMISNKLEGATFVVANTDAQALQQSLAETRIQLGERVTEGLGAGARPEVGAAAAEESIEAIVDHLSGAHMCFIAAGMGGGTGTGAAPIIARAAREMGVLTVGVVTKPFQFEGAKRMKQAEAGVEALQKVVDTLIIIPNQNLFRLANEKTTFTEAFAMADDVLYQGVKGVTDLMVRPGIINLDFADVRSVMDEMGKAMMGTGEAKGDDRAIQAAEKAIANPLLDEISLKGAKGVLINITGGGDLTLFELDEAANRIRSEVDPDANIIVGSTLDETLQGSMRVSVVATGIDAVEKSAETPLPRRSLAEPLSAPAATPAAAPAPSAPAPSGPVSAFVPAAPAPYRPEPAAQDSLFAPAAPQSSFVDAHRAAEFRHAETAEAEVQPVFRHAEPQPVSDEPALAPQAQAAQPTALPRVAGEPSPETLRRLKFAVEKQPSPPPVAPANIQKSGDEATRQPRFTINGLIHRLTGHDEPQQAALRQPPPVQAAPPRITAPLRADDREKVEIPAFLRRQAN
jgi:cell division protein FtsZ